MELVTQPSAPSEPQQPRRWVEHFRVAALSVGTYRIAAGGFDDQQPHTEDEIYVIEAGRARLVGERETIDVVPGSVVFVPAAEAHRFSGIAEDLVVLVIFVPAEYTAAGQAAPTADTSPA